MTNKPIKIRIVAINEVCHYPELLGKEFILEKDAPHTSDSWAFKRASGGIGNTWFMIHKYLTKIIK